MPAGISRHGVTAADPPHQIFLSIRPPPKLHHSFSAFNFFSHSSNHSDGDPDFARLVAATAARSPSGLDGRIERLLVRGTVGISLRPQVGFRPFPQCGNFRSQWAAPSSPRATALGSWAGPKLVSPGSWPFLCVFYTHFPLALVCNDDTTSTGCLRGRFDLVESPNKTTTVSDCKRYLLPIGLCLSAPSTPC